MRAKARGARRAGTDAPVRAALRLSAAAAEARVALVARRAARERFGRGRRAVSGGAAAACASRRRVARLLCLLGRGRALLLEALGAEAGRAFGFWAHRPVRAALPLATATALQRIALLARAAR